MNSPALRDIINTTSRKTIGLMSGTSADGLDIAYCDVNVVSRTLTCISASTIPFPDSLRERILAIAQAGSVNLTELMGMSTYLGSFYADSIEQFCAANHTAKSDIDLIGCHGQTIGHLSKPIRILDRQCRGTLQIGEAEMIAKTLGVVTVSDFRSGDIALGGSGAPLVPLYHQLRFAEQEKLRVIVNIGGIANITVLRGTTECHATDTGPGNCLIDTAMQAAYQLEYDEDGIIAGSGSINRKLLAQLEDDRLFSRPLPTSLDRKEMIDLLNRYKLLPLTGEILKMDLIATVTELTVTRIGDCVMELTKGVKPDSVLVCGGGVYNRYIMSRLQSMFGDSAVGSTGDFGSSPEFVEAEAFAYLANLTLDSLPGNLPDVTGAGRKAILGKIIQP